MTLINPVILSGGSGTRLWPLSRASYPKQLLSLLTPDKTMLQEKLQAERRSAPRYAVIETLGPPHQRIFNVEVSWDSGSICGSGHSIKAAEAAAARAALEAMTELAQAIIEAEAKGN